MPLNSTNLIPELQYWFSKFIIDSTLNKNSIFFPVELNILYLNRKSFIELLFNDNYNYSEYIYNYSEKTSKSTWPESILKRMMIYPLSAKYFISDSSGNNTFNLQSDDLTMLDALMQYRNDSTSVTIIDSTSNTLIFIDNILFGNINSCSTNLSKLIFIYLDFKINENFTNFNNINLISDSNNLLENMFECYVLENLFQSISSRSFE